MLDIKTPIFDHVPSLQTLHRMPSDTWERRPVFPTFFIEVKRNPFEVFGDRSLKFSVIQI